MPKSIKSMQKPAPEGVVTQRYLHRQSTTAWSASVLLLVLALRCLFLPFKPATIASIGHPIYLSNYFKQSARPCYKQLPNSQQQGSSIFFTGLVDSLQGPCSDENPQIPTHPYCEGDRYTVVGYDITDFIRKTLSKSEQSFCLFNPAVIHYKDNIFLWVMRGVRPKGSDTCQGAAHPEFGVWGAEWHLKFGIVLTAALVTHDLADGRPLEILYYKHNFHVRPGRFMSFPTDGRLFRDSNGDIMLYHMSGRTEGRPRHEQVSRVTRVQVVHHLANNTFSGTLEEQTHLPLEITKLKITNNGSVDEKNWVPWSKSEGNMMSYTHYPGGFAPHSVLKWGNYSAPKPHNKFVSEAKTPFMESFTAHYIKKNPLYRNIRFSGGTPAILLNSSWVAVGHMSTESPVFHRPRYNDELHYVGWTYDNFEGFAGWGHHVVDYFLYLYKFENTPPYRLTHISKAFKPPVLPPGKGRPGLHAGIVFPMGLELLNKDKLLISYGEDDEYVRYMIMNIPQFNELLMPIGTGKDIESALKEHDFCTLPLLQDKSHVYT